jgi:peptide/nickel transport system substrate-binding protein
MNTSSLVTKVMKTTLTLILLTACVPPTAIVNTSKPSETPESISVSTQTNAPTKTVLPTVSSNQTQDSIKGGTVTEAKSADAQSFQVYLTTDATSRDFQFKVYASGLWQRDPMTNLPIPYMAESWSVSDDGKTYTFNLRKDMRWSDGQLITTQDFVWTYDQAIKPENKYPYVSILNDIQSYTATDNYTLVITLKTSSCTGILTVGQITPLPKHIWENLPWSDPEKNPEILNPSVVSGPWKLKEWKRDEYAIFVPNELYFGEVPHLDSYVVQIVPEPSVQLQMLLNGEIDFASISATDYDQATKSEKLQLYSWDPAQPTWYFIGFNFKQPLLQDVEIRHALSYAIPQQLIADQIFKGRAKPIYSTYSPPNWVYNPNVPKYDYNLEKARDVLDKAGYKLDSNGNRLNKDGAPIKLRIYYPSTDPIRELIATIAQGEFKKIGIESEITGLESKALFDYLQKNPNGWDMWVGLSRDTSDPHFMYQAWSETTIPDINTGSYVNKQVEQLYTQGNTPPCDSSRRKGIYQHIQQIISEDSPYIFLVYNTSYAFVNKRIVVNPPTALGINYDLSAWRVQK